MSSARFGWARQRLERALTEINTEIDRLWQLDWECGSVTEQQVQAAFTRRRRIARLYRATETGVLPAAGEDDAMSEPMTPAQYRQQLIAELVEAVRQQHDLRNRAVSAEHSRVAHLVVFATEMDCRQDRTLTETIWACCHCLAGEEADDE